MRSDHQEIIIDDLEIDAAYCQVDKNVKQGLGYLSSDASQWILREFAHIRDFYSEQLCFDFLRFFSPDHMSERRSVFDIAESKKKMVGSAIRPVIKCDMTILNSRDFHLISKTKVGSALSALFFLNQSYARLGLTLSHLVERYQITEFGKVDLQSALSEEDYISFVNLENKSHSHFPICLSGAVNFSETTEYVVFDLLAQTELSLLNIVISPDFNLLFDFSHCDDIGIALNQRREQLREILLLSDRFAWVLFNINSDYFNRHFSTLFFNAEQYDQEKFKMYREVIVKNYIVFIKSFLISKFHLTISDLLVEVASSSISHKDSDDQKLYNGWKIKVTLCQFYLLLSEGTFFCNSAIDNAAHFFNLFSVLESIALFLHPADAHRIHLFKMHKLIENIIHAHPYVREFLSVTKNEMFDVGPSNEINLEEMIQWVPAWFVKIEQVGLESVLFNKNTLLIMFDRTVSQLSMQCEHSPLLTLRDKLVGSKTPEALNCALYHLMKMKHERFLIHFFRQLLTHCYCESRMIFYIQQVLAGGVMDRVQIANKIRMILDITIYDETIKLFWNRLSLVFDGISQEKEWCIIDEPIVVEKLSLSQASFFGSGVREVIARSADHLVSSAVVAASSDSAKSMKDSLSVLADKASSSMKTAADTAQEAFASVGSVIGTWWNQKR